MSTFTSAFLALALHEPLLQASLSLGTKLLIPMESIPVPSQEPLIAGLYLLLRSGLLHPQERQAEAQESRS